MFHACGILHHLSSHRHHSAVNKLLETVKSIILPLQDKQIGVAIAILDEHVPETKVNRFVMIRTIIRYTLLDTRDGVEFFVEDYMQQAVAKFTDEEVATILSVLDLSLFTFPPKTLYNIMFFAVFRYFSITK